MEMETLTEDARGSLRDGERNEVCELTNWMRGICGGCGYFSYRRDLILLTLMDSGQNSFALDALPHSVFHKIVSVSIVPRSS